MSGGLQDTLWLQAFLIKMNESLFALVLTVNPVIRNGFVDGTKLKRVPVVPHARVVTPIPPPWMVMFLSVIVTAAFKVHDPFPIVTVSPSDAAVIADCRADEIFPLQVTEWSSPNTVAGNRSKHRIRIKFLIQDSQQCC
jgi:hypothetical protein